MQAFSIILGSGGQPFKDAIERGIERWGFHLSEDLLDMALRPNPSGLGFLKGIAPLEG